MACLVVFLVIYIHIYLYIYIFIYNHKNEKSEPFGGRGP